MAKNVILFSPLDLHSFGNRLNISSLHELVIFGTEIAHDQCKDFSGKLRDSLIQGQRSDGVRSIIINKILSFQYHLGKLIGRKRARQICMLIEKTFTNLFGREVYYDGK